MIGIYAAMEGTVATNIYLGYEFLTDMFTLDIKYDTQKMVSMLIVKRRIFFRSASNNTSVRLLKRQFLFRWI